MAESKHKIGMFIEYPKGETPDLNKLFKDFKELEEKFISYHKITEPEALCKHYELTVNEEFASLKRVITAI